MNDVKHIPGVAKVISLKNLPAYLKDNKLIPESYLENEEVLIVKKEIIPQPRRAESE